MRNSHARRLADRWRYRCTTSPRRTLGPNGKCRSGCTRVRTGHRRQLVLPGSNQPAQPGPVRASRIQGHRSHPGRIITADVGDAPRAPIQGPRTSGLIRPGHRASVTRSATLVAARRSPRSSAARAATPRSPLPDRRRSPPAPRQRESSGRAPPVSPLAAGRHRLFSGSLGRPPTSFG